MKRRYGLIAANLLLVFILAIVSPQAVLASNYFVATAADLVTAIKSANAASGADTIILTANISLTSVAESNTNYGNTGLPTITSNITIEGQGHLISRSSAISTPNFRIFRVAATGTLTLYNLTISGGKATPGTAPACMGSIPGGVRCGSGLYNEGTLNLTHVTITANSIGPGGEFVLGSGLFDDGGTVNIYDSAFSNNFSVAGSGIYMDKGNLTIIDSLFSGNTASYAGGGIYITDATATIDKSTFTGNTAVTSDGATSIGGAIAAYANELTITNSTFSSNSANEGAGIELSGNAHLSNSTFSGNIGIDHSYGGGISITTSDSGSVVLDNLTFVGNTATYGGGIYNSYPPTLYIHNTIIVQSGAGQNCRINPISAFFSGADDLADDASCPNFTDLTNPPQNLNIGTLADNGGSTKTYAINSPSPALDSGSTFCTGFDQRGIARGIDANGTPNNPATGDCDIGAFEFGGVIRTLQFATASSEAPQHLATTHHIPLTLDSTLTQADTVKGYVWVSGGTAVAGVDYAPFGVQTVSITPNNITADAVITLLNSAHSNTDKTIVLSFATQHGPGFSGAVRLGTQLTHTITLQADTAPKRNYFTTNTPLLTWNRISQALRYEIQVSNNATFTGATIYDAGNNLSFMWPVVLPNGFYHWHVRACTNVAVTSCGAWSASDTFTVFKS